MARGRQHGVLSRHESGMSILNKVEGRLSAARRLLAIVEEIEDRNKEKFNIDLQRPSTLAVTFFFAKAWKTYNAVLILAEKRYGEDAMILARSLTSLCIDLAYICQEDSEERARDWQAVGKLTRKRLAKEFNTAPPDEATTDWDEIKIRAKRWKKPGSIESRARASGLLNFYKIAYRRGSSFEHSDSWSSLSYLERNEAGLDVRTEPSGALVSEALMLAAFSFAEIATRWGQFYAMDLGTAKDEMMKTIQSGFDAP